MLVLGATPSAVTVKALAVAARAVGAAFGVPVGLVFESEVVFVNLVSAEPESQSEGVSVTVPGAEQRAPQPPPLQAIDVLGAAPSAVTVKELALEASPAPF